MYQFSYAEVLEDAPQNAREREYEAFDRSVQLLRAAQKAGVQSRECVEAVLFTHRLWNILLDDLASPENDLPKELRAELISIGLWIVREVDQLRQGKAEGLQTIIDVSENIRDGLK